MGNPRSPSHGEVQKKIDRLEDKVDSRLDKIEEKVDRTGLAIAQINETLSRNTQTLEEHVRRTNALETQVDTNQKEATKRLQNLESSHKALMDIPDKIYKIAKWITTISAIISLVAGIAHLAIRLLMG